MCFINNEKEGSEKSKDIFLAVLHTYLYQSYIWTRSDRIKNNAKSISNYIDY
jgi:hypothetical protein